jgi:hypothetical protein
MTTELSVASGRLWVASQGVAGCVLREVSNASLCHLTPGPNGFPSPPQVSFPKRDERFALRGPIGLERVAPNVVTHGRNPQVTAAIRAYPRVLGEKQI